MVTIVTDLGIMLLGLSVLFYAAKTYEMQMIAKWLFLITLLFAVFELFVVYNASNPEIQTYFIVMLAFWLFLFAYDVIMFIPKAAELVSRRLKK